ncbi:MAG TPA: hypothetical protein VN616_06230 [Puia sp.]|nr:hypothetical protein [Puia sp.]
MNSGYKNFINHIMQDPGYHCPVCGAARYVTDQGNHELTLHCSSLAARFWDYPRGSADQATAIEHWDRSRKDVFLSMEDVLRYLVAGEAVASPGTAVTGPERPPDP